jgi:hypothetical protein
MSMSTTIQLSESGSQELPATGAVFPYAAGELDAISKKAGARPVSEFYDDSEMLSEEECEEAGIERKEPQWFAAAEGLRTIDALIVEFESRDPNESLGEEWNTIQVEEVLLDLRAARSILAKAAETGEQFKFSVG